MPFIIKKPEPQKTAQAIVNSSQDFEIVGGVLKKYTGAATDVVIPEGVVEIANGAFYNMPAIASIKIPEGLKRIGSKRFKPSEPPCFFDCKGLQRINIPDSIELIGNNVPFCGCDSLREVDISTEKLLSLTYRELNYGLSVFSKRGAPYRATLLQRIKQECKNRGICWSCRKPLVLDNNDTCHSCGQRGHL